MQPGLSRGLQAEGNKNQCFTAEAKRRANVNSVEIDREGFCVYKASKNRLNPARHRRHADVASCLAASAGL